MANGRSNRGFSELLAATALAATTCLFGCSSPQAVIDCSNPDQVLRDVRALYVVVAPEAKINPDTVQPDDKDYMALLRDLDRDALTAYAQLRPTTDPKQRLIWEVVAVAPEIPPHVDLGIDWTPGTDGGRLRAIESAIEVEIDGDFLEINPETSVLLVVQFKNGAEKPPHGRFVGKLSIAAGTTQVFDVRDGKLQPRQD